MTSTGPSFAGTLLDRRYRVDGLLARGGMSAVYRGVDTRLDRPVAIKIMDSRFADDRTFVDRFENEARSAARLHHPNVVAVHDQGFDTSAGPESKRAFLVMELVDGGTLRDLLDQRGALDVPLALTVFESVLSALAAAHAAGLVHRDVKPENVLIGRGGDAGGVAKVGDFGLVRAVAGSSTTSADVILGTVAYLSPEQVTSGSAGAPGDVYSAGILLYEMLTGRVPYSGDTALSVAYRHVNDDVPAPSREVPGLPPALDELVLRATRRDPNARPADAGAFLAEFARVREELGIARVPIPVPSAPVEEQPDVERTMPVMPTVPAAHGAGGPRGTQALPRDPRYAAPASAYPDTEPEAPAARSGLWTALWVLVGLLLVGGIATGVWWFMGGRWVEVPKVVGMEQQRAEQVLRQAELTPVVTEERHNTTPSGTVIRTEPENGSRALRGEQITVVVSLGRPVVPDIAPGTPLNHAEQAIRDMQLTPKHDPAADEYSAEVPKGTVVRVQPRPGSQANLGDQVTLIVSKGPPPTPVPQVTGMSKQEAFQALREAGFEPFEAGEEFAEGVPAGQVTRTDPQAGATPGNGQRVGVYVSNAVEVPVVIGQPTDRAVRILSRAGLSADADSGTGRFSFVVGQDPSPGTFVARGTTVHLEVIP
ncbi:serine/threonine-protein kinase [Saccharomonospora amisosensis]|uniref:non-specific serine/threonine protein kinase n=1 Tax=Saccharomonospora amisosensis TaxID=1128677 RepID=A0A7X5ZPX3_9PSEU|nr:PASTA domain-containing protein [Saccharomonospora amisosensis]NIJ11184.1 serine/threonine-protein kinase [Saccharomonospora amisosensis]